MQVLSLRRNALLDPTAPHVRDVLFIVDGNITDILPREAIHLLFSTTACASGDEARRWDHFVRAHQDVAMRDDRSRGTDLLGASILLAI
jgi:hypothetical protein